MYNGPGTTVHRESLGTRLGLWMGIDDNHGGREKRIMVCTKVKGHTLNLFSWSLPPYEKAGDSMRRGPKQTSIITWQHKCIAEEH